MPANRSKHNRRPIGWGAGKQLTERIRIDTLRFLWGLHAPLALPLGELSPQVTERALQPVLDGKVNLSAHTTERCMEVLPLSVSQIEI